MVKVLFVFGAMPHYMLSLLNLLSNVKNLEIVVILPTKKGNTVGAGVYETDKNAKFKIIRTEEKPLFILGKAYFRSLGEIIKEEKPQILVIGWPYIIGFIFDFSLKNYMKKNDIKLIFRSIPYQIPLYKDAERFFREDGFFTEDMQHIKANTFLKKIKYKIFTELSKYYYRLADAHLNYSTSAYEILESYGVLREKIFVSYNSGDTDELFKAKEKIKTLTPILPTSNQRIIHVGRLIKWKKVEMLINVFAQIFAKYPQAELIIVGNGPEEENLKNQVKILGLEKNVIFAGAVHEPTLLGQYLTASTIYVLAGVGGLSINDAMAFGKPVICSVADSTEKDLVIANQTGFIFENDNAEDLKSKIIYLFDNPEKCQEMGKNAENLIKEKINIHTVAGKFVDVFNFVTNQKYTLQYGS